PAKAGAANEARSRRATTGRRSVRPRAYQDCRAGFAGRDMQVVRARGVPHSPPDPTQDVVLGRLLWPVRERVDRYVLLAVAPAAAERGVQLHYRQQLVALGLRQLVLCGEELLLRLEYLEVGCEAAGVADGGELRRLLERLHGLGALLADVLELLGVDQGVGDVAQGGQDDALVLPLRGLPGGDGRVVATVELAGLARGAVDRRRARPE